MSIGFLRETVSYSDLCGEKLSIDVALDILKDFRLSSIVDMIAKLNFLLFKEGYEEEWQKWLVNASLDVEIREKALRRLDGTGRIVFNRMQLLMLLRLACSVCNEDGNKTFEDEKYRFEFGHSALIVNDFLYNKESSSKESGYIELLPDLIRTLELTNFSTGADIIHPMVRWYVMLFEIAKTLGRSRVDIDSLMNTIYGMSLEKYYGLIFATFSYLNRLEIKDLMTSPANFLINTTSFLDVPGITDLSKQYSKLEPDIVELSQIGQKIQETDHSFPKNSFMTFRQYPLIRFNPDRVLCIDLCFLVDKLSSGIYWAIHRLLSERSNESVEEFMTYRGKLFETYIDDLFRDTYPESSVVLTPIRYLSPPDFEDSDYGDGIICSEDSKNIAFLEYKSSLLSVETKYSGDPNLLQRKIEKKFVEKGVTQLAQKISNFADINAPYVKPIKGVDRASIRRIFPILIVLEPVMRTPFIGDYLNTKFQEKLSDHNIDSRFSVCPLILLTVDDLERSIPYLSARGTWECLNDYIANDYYYKSGFSIYIKDELYRDGFVQSPFIKQKFDKIRSEIMTVLSGSSEIEEQSI